MGQLALNPQLIILQKLRNPIPMSNSQWHAEPFRARFREIFHLGSDEKKIQAQTNLEMQSHWAGISLNFCSFSSQITNINEKTKDLLFSSQFLSFFPRFLGNQTDHDFKISPAANENQMRYWRGWKYWIEDSIHTLDDDVLVVSRPSISCFAGRWKILPFSESCRTAGGGGWHHMCSIRFLRLYLDQNDGFTL